MQSNQAVGIDLPLKALAWQDANGLTWLSLNDPTWVARRHGLGADAGPTVNALAATLSAVVTKATEQP